MTLQALVERVSLAGGQLGRELRFRSDLGRYQISVEDLQNYVTMVAGGATRAPGTRMVLELKDQAQQGKLVPFRRSSSDYYMLVINGGVSRFVRQGGFVQNPDTSPHELAVPFTEDDLPNLRSAPTGADIYLVDGTRYQKITYTSALSWSIAAVQPKGGPVDTQNLDTAITVLASAQTGNGINLTGVGNPFTADQVGSVFRLDDRDLGLTPQWRANEGALAVGALRRNNGKVYSVVSGADSGPNAPTHDEGDVSSGQGFVTWRFEHPGYGFVRVASFTNGNAATGDVLTKLPNTVVSGATYRWSAPAWDSAKGYPTTIAFASPRMFLGRSEYFWLSAVDDVEDLTDTGEDDGAIAGRLRSPDGSLVEINWAMPAGALIVGTSDIEWVFRAASLFEPLTGKNLKPIPDNNDGSAQHIPAFVDGGTMYVGKSGMRLHYGTIDAQKTGAQRFDAEEVSVSARDIFKAGIKAMAWQRDPQRVLWIVRKDGSLCSFTFMPKQQIAAFAVHPRSNAFFEDVAVIPSTAAGVDEVYFIIRRTIAGATKRYVEQLADFFTPEDLDNPTALGAWFLDCALYYEGAKISNVTNLAHLEGEEVAVFADGAMQARKTVTDGAITLDRAAAKLLVGLPIVARIKDLPRNVQTPEGGTKAQDKIVREGVLDLEYAGGGTLRVNGGDEERIIETGGKKYGSPVKLFSGTKRIPVDGEIASEAALELINDDAMPCTVLGLSPRVFVEEEG